MSPHRLTFLTLLVAGCSDTGITKLSASPEAVITDPADGADVREGQTVTLAGAVSDPDGSPTSLTVTWKVDGVAACEDAAPDGDGLTTCATSLPPGTIPVTLTVRDPGGATGTDSIELNVAATDAPEVQITAPAEDARLYADLPVLLEGLTTDGEDPADALRAAWTSSVDGDIELDMVPENDGVVSVYASLAEGSHGLTLTVVDTDGKTGRDQRTVTVGPANRTPTCTITSPTDGALLALGADADLGATVADDDQPAAELDATWRSSRDGELLSTHPAADGTVDFTTSSLSAGAHTLTFTTTDERGATCTDAIDVMVGAPPTVAITLPADGSWVNVGELVPFSGLVSDDADLPTALTIEWSSDLDGTLSTTAPDATGAVAFDSAALVAGTHTITLAATDTDGLVGTDTTQLNINGLPSAPGIEILPDPAVTGDDLVATVVVAASDPEADPLTLSHAWTRNGVATAHTTATVPASATSRGEVWAVAVTADDGRGTGPAGTDSITIGNTAPVASAVTLSPSTAATHDSLVASPVGSDADGDAVSWLYQWTVDGTTVSPTTASLDGALWFDKHEVVIVTATPYDGTDFGTPVSSAGVTIVNTPPEAPVVAIDPSSPTTTDDLYCDVVTGSIDDDSDTITYSIAWTVDGVAYPSGSLDTGDTGFAWSGPSTTTWPDDTVPADDVALGVEWTCTVTPDDGDDVGASASDTVTVSDHCSGETVTVAWVEGWGSGYGDGSLSWSDLETNWATYGGCPVVFTDVHQPFTLSTLTATGADVVLLSDPSGGTRSYSTTEMTAIETYVQGGSAGVVATYMLDYVSYDNSRLAELVGVSASSLVNNSSAVSGSMTVQLPTHPLATNLPSSWTATSFLYEQQTVSGWPSALLSGAVVVAGTGTESRIIAYPGSTWNGVFLTGMLEYQSTSTDSHQALYNSLIWASGRLP